MRSKVHQAGIISVFLLLILFPLFQQVTDVIPEPRLAEKRPLATLPGLVPDSLLSGEFQNQFDRYMNDNYGFRAWVIMINNQIDIAVFRVTR
jgi:hypothetical protein